MSLPTAVEDALQALWWEVYVDHLNIKRVQPLSGGSINQVRLVGFERGQLCLKYNTSDYAADMLEKEAKGLDLLWQTDTIRVPKCYGFREIEGGGAILAIEYLTPENTAALTTDGYWKAFGLDLAELHLYKSKAGKPSGFGLDHDNYMGSLPQSNTWHTSFADFFWNERLAPQLKLARDKGALSNSQVKQFDNLQMRIGEICPEEPPALIHGDLWSGNFVTGPGGYAAIIDPAVAYSHRECDLAMTRLFGGFAPEFYDAYHEAYPLEPGFDDRVDFYNLYPLLVHVNLFGGGYVEQAMGVLKSFV